MSRMFLSSSSCVLLFLLCLLHECNGRHLSTTDHDLAMDNKLAKTLTHSTIKGFGNDVFKVHEDHLNLEKTAKGKDETNNYKKDMMKFQRSVKKVKEPRQHHHNHHHHHHKSCVAFKVPPRNKQVHQHPGFSLDYAPPKTHPPSHN